jgi:hypothetical protein
MSPGEPAARRPTPLTGITPLKALAPGIAALAEPPEGAPVVKPIESVRYLSVPPLTMTGDTGAT